MRYLAIDLGDKRTGLATGDHETGMVFPAGQIAIPRTDEARLVGEVVRAIEENGAQAVVIGLPVNMDGSEGAAANRVRGFGELLAAARKVSVHYQDERLTSFAADQSMSGSGRTRGEKKQLRDALAAAEILRDFLAARRG